jgi:membrane protein implicated in regulation of membrane protease activity
MSGGIFSDLGPWNWIVLGCILLALEIVVPGVYLLWIGIAAILTGALSLQLWSTSFWVWEVQVLVFLALSLTSAFAGKKIIGGRQEETDAPLLNRRREQLIGRTATLAEPITEGRGRIKIGDTVWRVAGPDLPAGARVRVANVGDTELIVEAV